MIKYSRPLNATPMISFAQNCEDVMIDRVFRKKDGFFIDVGASHPIHDSVTKYLSILGWHGINIEPSAPMFEALVRDRPNDINLHCAAGRSRGIATFHQLPNTYMSTTNIAHLDSLGTEARSASTPVPVEMRTLTDIAAEFVHQEVDLLKIDAEGSEFDVIQGADWNTLRPRLLVIEAVRPWSPEPYYETWEPVLLAHEYQMAFFDGINRYYLRNEDRSLMDQLAAPVNLFDCYKTLRQHQLETRIRELENELTTLKTAHKQA